MKLNFVAVLTTLGISSTAAIAEPFHFTFGIEQAQGTIVYHDIPSDIRYNTTYTAFSLTAAQKFDLSGPVYIGYDASIGIPVSQNFPALYSLDTVVRGRVVLGFHGNGFDVYTAAGRSMAVGTFRTETRLRGTNSALGVNFRVADSANIQIEAYREDLTDGLTSYSSDWHNSGLRAGAVVKF